MTCTVYQDRRAIRLAWVPPAVATALVTGVLAWGAVESAHNREWLLSGHQWWRLALGPGAAWTLPVLLGLWLAALALYWWPRRHRGSNVSFIALLSMVVAGVGLGEASFVPCSGGQEPFVAPLSWVLILFTGSLEPRFGPGTGCPGQLPLALQLARFLCLGATFGGVAAAAAVLWRQEIDKHKTRFLGELTVITGLDAMTVSLLDKFVTESSGRRVVLVESDPNHALLEEARATGARVIIDDPTRPDALRPVLTHLGKPAARRMFALHPGAQDNEAILAAAREVLRRATRRAEHHPHLVARVDDPRHADTWRGMHISSHQPWLEDALSPCETTAVFAVRAVLTRGARTLVLCGDTTLALAILIEAARAAWEEKELAMADAAGGDHEPASGRAFPSILVMADRAGDLKREFAATVSPQLQAALPGVRIAATPWRRNLLKFLDSLPSQEAADCVVVVTDEPTAEGAQEAGRVARLHPRTVIYAQSIDDIGGADVAFDNLHQFRVGFLVDGVLPVDTWTRLARHNHERYRLRWPVPAGSPGEPARRPWDDLDEFFREENIRQVRQVLASAVALGRLWRPLRSVPPGSVVEFTDSELAALAQEEHGRWYARRVAADWHSPGTGEGDGGAARVQGTARRVNPSVVPWDALPDSMRQQNALHVASILTLLEAIGYIAVLPDDGPGHAAPFVRRGEVRAVRLDAPRVWEAANGAALRAEPGDWNISDEQGHERTVRDAEFRTSHEYLGGDRWARVGMIRAWQVTEPTTVRTLEGPAVAAKGDWIAQGRNGERWPVPAGQFAETYVACLRAGRRTGHAGGASHRSRGRSVAQVTRAALSAGSAARRWSCRRPPPGIAR